MSRNNAEWVPLGIVLLLLLELGGLGSLPLHVLGGTLLFARVAHAHGALAKSATGVLGAVLTYLVILAMGVYALVLHVRS